MFATHHFHPFQAGFRVQGKHLFLSVCLVLGEVGCCPFRFFVAKESVYSWDPRPINPQKIVVKILVVTDGKGRGTTDISPNMCLIN